eukprot:TRINITY_DN2815_c0_g2_i4.p1 TRINITY_DN2815_c0_g2~~TRINITY_DN2815_c0_g2_i4.p1  ORF type:complete len:208 (-),score=52.71 TRINITY_DN2815_c0_g2_i4:277-900(-)
MTELDEPHRDKRDRLTEFTEVEKQRKAMLDQKKRKERLDLSLSDIEELQRKRQELLEQKRRKQQELAAIDGDSVAVLSKKRDADEDDGDSQNKKDFDDVGRKGNRKPEDENSGPPVKKFKTNSINSANQSPSYSSFPVGNASNAITMYDIRNNFMDLRREHRRHRKLLKDQKIQLTRVAEYVSCTFVQFGFFRFFRIFEEKKKHKYF